MRSRPTSWKHLFTKLGFTRRNSSSKSTAGFHRKLRFEQCEDRRMLAIFTVDSLLDNTIADGSTTLREAINAANFDPDPDTIEFSTVAADGLDGGTILLQFGELDITESVTINASMLSGGIKIDAGNGMDVPTGDGSRIFYISGESDIQIAEVTLKGLTLTGGDVSGSGGAISQSYYTDVTIEDSIITGNHATGNGGGLFASAGEDDSFSLLVKGSEVSGNTAGYDGGGIFAKAPSDYSSQLTRVIEISKSLISGNTASNRGGGIFTLNYDGTETLIEDSRITGNHAGSGGRVPTVYACAA